ncbi:ER membrane protein complex subunit 3 [Diplonema papillatum]|nr:ER membrane protein complex subunit 3 [Diplonema papillatum]
MQEVLLDPGIREWALIPIVVVTLLLQLLKHYIALLMKSPKQVSAEYQRETQTLQQHVHRSRVCPLNCPNTTQPAKKAN